MQTPSIEHKEKVRAALDRLITENVAALPIEVSSTQDVFERLVCHRPAREMISIEGNDSTRNGNLEVPHSAGLKLKRVYW